MKKCFGPPDIHTPGNVGDYYLDQNTEKVYKCVEVKPEEKKQQFVTTYDRNHHAQYVWEERVNADDVKIEVDDCYYLFYNGKRLNLLPKITVSPNCQDFSHMFYGCRNVTEIPPLNTSEGTNFSHMFYDCRNVTEIPPLDTSNGTGFANMFMYCVNLKTIPPLDTSNGTDFPQMFDDCYAITDIPPLETGKAYMLSYMFRNCKELVTIRGVDLETCVGASDMFKSCAKLTNLTIYNIGLSLQIASGTSWGHLLTVDSLVHTIRELRTLSYQNTLTMGSTNLAKIADLYCKVTDDTNEKLTMELCESTDEGAMTLAEYAALKNWLLK